MDDRLRRILRDYRVALVTELDPSPLYDPLLEKGVFTQDMIDDVKSHGTRRNQARQLVQDLEKRGSQAFQIFVQCLQETEQLRLYELLLNAARRIQLPPARPERNAAGLPALKPLPLRPPADVAPTSLAPKPAPTPTPTSDTEDSRAPPPGRTRRDSIQCYKMDASPCGHCLIINNVEFESSSGLSNRKGSNVDCDKLEGRFRSLGFIVEVQTNLRCKQIRQELSALSKRDHSANDCCVVVMLSHGTETSHNRFPGAVFGVDGLEVPVQKITNYLNGQNCPSLQGKPKLFFIQACGGDEKDPGYEVSPEDAHPSPGGEDDQTDAIPMSSSSDSLSASDELDARASLPTPSDILVSYSTFPGYVSWRDTQAGSWYVECLDRVLEENASTDDLATMLMMVNHEVSQNSAKGLYKQMPGSFNFLRKLLYFQSSS